MRRVVALYGPPGAGKSTVILAARARGWDAHDAESFGLTHEARVAGLNQLVTAPGEALLLIGAADLTPEEFPPNTRFVLLLPPPEEHRRRVVVRNDQRRHKSLAHAQAVHREHEAMRSQFGFVIEDVCAPEVVLERIAGDDDAR